jgi:hypothetical protein
VSHGHRSTIMRVERFEFARRRNRQSCSEARGEYLPKTQRIVPVADPLAENGDRRMPGNKEHTRLSMTDDDRVERPIRQGLSVLSGHY